MASPRGTARVLVPLLALIAAACASLQVPRAPLPGSATEPPVRVFVGGPEETEVEAAVVADGEAATTSDPDPLHGRGDWIVSTPASTVYVYGPPRAEPFVLFALETFNPWGQQIAFPVLRARRSTDGTVFYRVLLGIEPNGARGWIRATDVTLERATDRIVVDMSKRVLRHFRDGGLAHRFRIGIGKPSTPTTPGSFFVWAQLEPRDSWGSYGSYVLGLSGFSEVLTYWPGGGRMAIHGTPDRSDRGGQVSFGCVRVYNRQMDRLRDVPMGTMVVIRP